MVRFSLIASACCATLASLGFASAAQGFTVSPGPATDLEFNNLLTSGYIREVYVPGARGGNNSFTTAERELEILDPLDVDFANGYPGTILPTSQIPLASGQKVWGNGTPNNFSIVYNPAAPSGTPKITFTLGSTTLTANQFNDSVTEIFLRTRVGSQNSAGTFTSSLSNLVLNGTTLNQGVSSSCTRVGTAQCSDVDYLRISGLNGGFTLTGTSTFAWSAGNMPAASRMMFQVKAAAPGPRANNSAPAPGMIAGMALAGAGSLWKKLKRKQQAVG
jgi:hypothetical protein